MAAHSRFLIYMGPAANNLKGILHLSIFQPLLFIVQYIKRDELQEGS